MIKYFGQKIIQSNKIFNDLLNILFPNFCENCRRYLNLNEKIICLYCLEKLNLNLPFEIGSKVVLAKFYGKTNIKAAYVLYNFKKNSVIRCLLHSLKYKGKDQIGIYLGEILSHFIKKESLSYTWDAIIPVPLHKKKIKAREYNQSELIAQKVSNYLKIPHIKNCLIKKHYTNTQTKKNKFNRWDNVKSSFEVLHPKMVADKNILLIDDVITTGATLEACTNTLLHASVRSVSVATLAVVA